MLTLLLSLQKLIDQNSSTKKWSEEIPACKIILDKDEPWWDKDEKRHLMEKLEQNQQDFSNYNYPHDFHDSYYDIENF